MTKNRNFKSEVISNGRSIYPIHGTIVFGRESTKTGDMISLTKKDIVELEGFFKC